MPKPFVVDEDEGPVANDRASEGGAKIILDEVIRAAQLVERAGVECAIAQKVIGCPVKLVRPRARHNVDLHRPFRRNSFRSGP